MGGGFGAKFGPIVEGVLAGRLSKEAKAPVKIMLTRFDQALAVGNRPSSFQKIKLGAKEDGTLHAFDFDNYGTAGVGAGGASEGGGSGLVLRAPYIYKVANTRVKQTAVGCAGSSWGGGGRGTHAEAEVHSDGSVEIRCGTQDLGTGTRTHIALVAAEVFGVKPEQITVRIGDTRFPPSGGSGGSSTSP